MLSALLLVALAQMPPPVAKRQPALSVPPVASSGIPIGLSECQTGVTLLGSRGEAVTTTIAGTSRTCETSAGVVVPLAANQSSLSGGAVWIEPTTTNLIAAGTGRDFSQAGWTKTNMGCALNAVGKTGAANSASTCTATANSATVCQTLTVAAASRTTSIDVKRVTGTGAVSLSRDATTYATLSRSYCVGSDDLMAAPNSSSFVRCRVTSSVLNPQICLKLATSGDAVVLDYAQDEPGSVATSRLLGGATRTIPSAMDVTMPAAVVDSEGCMGASIWVAGPTGANQGVIGLGGGSSLLYLLLSGPVYVAGSNIGSSAGWATSANVHRRWVPVSLGWSAGLSQMVVSADNVSSAPITFDGTIVTTPAHLGLYQESNNALNGRIKDVTLGTSMYGCQSLAPVQYGVLAIGDSISAPPNTWPARMSVDANHVVLSTAVAGNTTAQMLTRWTATDRARGLKTVFVLGGINDICGDVPVTTAYSNLSTIYDQAKADGANVIPVTVLPFGANVCANANRVDAGVTLNAMIKNYASDAGWSVLDAYAMTASDPGDGGFMTLDSGTGTTDGLHPGSVGYWDMAAAAQVFIQ